MFNCRLSVCSDCLCGIPQQLSWRSDMVAGAEEVAWKQDWYQKVGGV